MELTAGDTMREMRSLLLALRPLALTADDLPGALAGVCRSYGERLGIPVSAELDPAGLEPGEVPPAVEHAILRVTQEAVANAARHAAPSRITVRLEVNGGHAVLEVADDGRGFDVTARPLDAARDGGGLGLHTMRDRVAELGGLLTVESTPGQGTRVHARFPLRAASRTAEAVTAEAVTAAGVTVPGVTVPGVTSAGSTREGR